MAIEYKNYPSDCATNGTTVLTCPANKALIVKTVNAAHSNDGGTNTAVLEVVDGSTVTPLISAVSITSATAQNLLTGVLALTAGQSLVARNPGAGNSTSVGNNILSAACTGLLSNSAGTTLIAVTASFGIYRSTDTGKTWTRVYTGAVALASGVYVVATTTFFIYLTTTSALKSTDDGLTWASQVVVAAPVYASGVRPTGCIIKNGSTYVGPTTSTQLVSTTDGITWANFGVVLTTGTISQLTHTGTHYVVASGAAEGIYRTTDGAAWAAVSVGGLSPTGIASNGAGVLITATTAAVYYSTDHGATVTASTGASSITVGCFYTGASLVAGINSGTLHFTEPAVPQLVRTVSSTLAPNTANITTVLSSRVVSMTTSATKATKTNSTDMADTRYGISIFASAAEKTQ